MIPSRLIVMSPPSPERNGVCHGNCDVPLDLLSLPFVITPSLWTRSRSRASSPAGPAANIAADKAGVAAQECLRTSLSADDSRFSGI